MAAPNYYDLLAYQNGIKPPVYSGRGYADMMNAQRPGRFQTYANVGSQALNSFFPESSPQQEYLNRLAEIRLEQLNRQHPQAPSGPAGGGSFLDWFSSGGSSGLGSLLGGGSSAGSSGMVPVGSAMNGGTMYAAAGANGATSLGTAASGLSGMGELGTGALGSGMTSAGLLTAGAGLGAAGYGAYNLLSNRDKWDDKDEWAYGARNGAIAGAGIGTMILPGVGTAIGGALGGLGGAVATQFGGGKHKDQRQRDTLRKRLKDAGAIDDKYNLTLADGNKFDIGKDGKIKNYNVDFNRAGAGDAVGALNPLAMIMTGGDRGKKRSDLAGYYANAAMSSGNSSDNIKKFYADAGHDHDSAYGLVHQLQQEGKISKEAGDQAKNALDQQYGVGAYAKRRK